MSEAQFNPLIHGHHRLKICAVLAAMAEIEFKVLREKLGVSDSVLSKQLKTLEDADYLLAVKRTDMGRQRTWLALSNNGRNAYLNHVKALRDIVGQE